VSAIETHHCLRKSSPDGVCVAADFSPPAVLFIQSHATLERSHDSTESLSQSAVALRNRATAELNSYHQLDEAIAESIKNRSVDASKVAWAINKGIHGVLKAVVHFSAKPARVAEGISKLGSSLFEVVDSLLPSHHKTQEEYKRFKTAWDEAFQSIPKTAVSVERDIDAYVRDGAPDALIRAITTLIDEVSGVITNFLPPKTGVEVMKYLDAITDALQYVSDSWESFHRGDTVSGIESVYFGLRNITDDLIPMQWRNSTTYKLIVGAVDSVISKLSNNVLEYERRILESSCCWRRFKKRERSRPKLCSSGYIWGGERYCYPDSRDSRRRRDNSAGLVQTEVEVEAETDSGVARKRKRPRGAIPARCDENGRFSSKQGHWCYASCPSGMRPKRGGMQCKSSCSGNFSASTPLMCGTDSGMITRAIVEMATVVLNSAFSLADTIMKMKKDGVNGELLSGTIQTFIDLGKPFAHPLCPIVEEQKIQTDGHGNSKSDNGIISSSDGVAKAVPGKTIALHSKYHSRFVRMNDRVDMSSSAPRSADDLPASWTWERFEVIDAGNKEIALHSAAHNRFVRMHNNGKMKATKLLGRDGLPPGYSKDRFTVVDAGNGQIALHNEHHNRFVMMHKSLNMISSKRRSAYNLPSHWAWERFTVVEA